jgi:hypothetical protein
MLFITKELSCAISKVKEYMVVKNLGDIRIDVGAVILDPDEEEANSNVRGVRCSLNGPLSQS